jgi:pimeloyl-ACP methyl ester carboxylesterase
MMDATLTSVETIVGGILGGVALLVLVALLYRTARQALTARALAIRASAGIQQGEYIQIGGRPQWVQIRGEDRVNPVLLVLHGGPGIAYSPFTALFRAWERDFTVVQWDQPGAGKTASRNGKSGYVGLSVEGMVDDSVEVAQWVLRRLGQRRLIIFGTSWGSLLGLHLVKRRPDLVLAYVGEGQFVDGREGARVGYELGLARARQLGKSDAITALETVGPPPYHNTKTFLIKQRALGQVDLETANGRRFPNIPAMVIFAPGYTLRDSLAYFRGLGASRDALEQVVLNHDLRTLGADFTAPLFFFQGAHDLYTPAQPVEAYVATLRAPWKELVLWEDEAHLTFLTNPAKIHQELVSRVRPLALARSPD